MPTRRTFLFAVILLSVTVFAGSAALRTRVASILVNGAGAGEQAPSAPLALLSCESLSGGVIEVEGTGGTAAQPTGYSTLTAAFNAINNGGHTGTVTVEVCGNATEPGSAVLNSSGAGSASYTSVSIYPLLDNVTISGASAQGRGLIELNGADNVTIDGDNPLTAGTNRNLTLQNTAASTTTFAQVLRIALNTTTVASANNCAFKNLIIAGNATGRNVSLATNTSGSENRSYGILVGLGASGATTAPSAIGTETANVGDGATASNLKIENNAVNTAARGIAVQGSAQTVFPGLRIENNFIGNPTAGDPDQVYSMGITAQGSTDAVIRGNSVYVESFVGTPLRGIDWGSTNTAISGSGLGTIIEKNRVLRVRNNRPQTSGAYGINIQGTTNNHIIKNNFVTGIRNDQTSGTNVFTTVDSASGIRIGGGIGHKVLHNSVHLTGSVPGTLGSTFSACLLVNGTSNTGLDIRNNIFSNQMGGGNPSGTVHATVYLPSGGNTAMNLLWNNNAYFQGPHANSRLAQVGTTYGSGEYLAANFNPATDTPPSNFRAYTRTLSSAEDNDNASFATASSPPFVSDTDLHISSSVALESTGANAGVSDDIDGDSRSAATPDIGADEFAAPPPPPQPGVIQFSAATYSGSEEGGTIVVTVTRTGGSDGAVSADYTLGGGSATGGAACGGTTGPEDFVNTGGTVAFGAGDAADKAVSVAVCSDVVFEGPQTFNAALANAQGGATLGAQASAVVTIADDDAAPTVSILDVTQAEGNAGTSNFAFTVFRSGSPSEAPIVVDLHTEDGTAAAPGDYAAVAAGQVTIPSLGPSAVLNVQVVGDTAFEPNETFFVEIDAVSVGTIGDGSATGTITNDDLPAVSLQLSAATGTEAAATVITVTAVADGPVAGAQTVELAVSGTNITAGDHSLGSTTITIPDGSTTGSTTFTILNDTVYEGTESALLTIGSPSAGIVLGAVTQLSVSITDDESPPTVAINDVSLAEGNAGTTTFTFAVTKTGDTELAASVTYATSDGSATGGAACGAGVDYVTAAPTVLTFLPNETLKNVQVSVCGDTVPETGETFLVGLSSAVNAGISDNQGLGTIANDDPPPVNIQLSAGSGTEAAGSVITVTAVADVPVTGAQTVEVAVSGTNITAGDYSLGSTTITIANGSTTGSTTFTILNDTIYEGTETAVLTFGSPSSGIVLGFQVQGTIDITDNESPPTLSINDVSLAEGNAGPTVFSFTVSKTGATELAANVNYATGSGTATGGAACGPGTDYVAIASTGLTFLPNETSKNVQVTVCGDTDQEPNETFVVNLSTSVNANISDNQGLGTILNDDGVTLVVNNTGDGSDITPGNGICETGAGNGICTLRAAVQEANALVGPDVIAFSALFNSPQTIVQTGDALGIQNALTINGPGADKLTVDRSGTARIFSVSAPTRISGMTMRGGSNSHGGALHVIGGTLNVDRMNFVDNVSNGHGGAVFLGSGGSHQITNSTFSNNQATTSGGAVQQDLGDLTITNCTFTGNTAGIAGGAIENIGSGQTVVRNSTIVNNSAQAGGGISSFGSFSIGSTVVAGNTAPSNPDVRFVTGSFTSAGFNLVGDSPGDAADTGNTFTYLATDILNMPPLLGPLAGNGGPTPTRKPLPGSPVVDKGSSFGVLTDQRGLARIFDDPGIGQPAGGDAADIGAVEAQSALSAGSLQFSAAAYSGSESAGTITLSVTRTGGSDGAASAVINYSGGTAIGGGACGGPTSPPDYVNTTAGVSFADGDSAAKTVNIQICNDIVYEGDQAFTATMSNILGAAAGGQTSAAVTIQDDDAAPSVSIADVSQAEGNSGTTTFAFAITRSGSPSELPIVIDLHTEDGTAASPSDYASFSGQVTIPATGSGVNANITVNGDVLVEPDETFAVVIDAVSVGTIADGSATGTILNDDNGQAFNGSVNVGSAESITSLTNNGGLFQQLNAGTLSGNLTVNITSHLTGETGTHALNQLSETGAGNWTVTLQAPGGPKTIGGANNTSALIRLNGADRIVFDCTVSGPGGLTFRNAGTSSTFLLENDASDNEIRNCIIEGGDSGGLGVVRLGGGNSTGNDNNLLSDSVIRDRTDAVDVPEFLLVDSGGPNPRNSGNEYRGNQFVNYTHTAISIHQAADATVAGNSVFQTAPRATTLTGISIEASTGANNVSGNTIRDHATAGGFLGFRIADAEGTLVDGNRIYNIDNAAGNFFDMTGIRIESATPAASVFLTNNMISLVPTNASDQRLVGISDIRTDGGLQVLHNSVLIGGTASGGSTWAYNRTVGRSTSVLLVANIFFNNRTGVGGSHFAIGDQSAGGGSWSSNFNLFAGTGDPDTNYFDLGLNFFGTPVDKNAWSAGPPARDANSPANVAGTGPFNIANIFISPSDLHLRITGFNPAVNAGTATGLTTDYDGQTRPFNGVPDIGADEVQAAPTAGTAEISGRVTTGAGRGIANVRITVFGPGMSPPVSALSNAFGYFTIPGLRSGESYIVSVSAKRYIFLQQHFSVLLNENFTEANFIGEPR